MKHRIAPPSYGGKFDETIEWVKRLENKIEVWIAPEKPPCYGLLAVLQESEHHYHVLTFRPDGFQRSVRNDLDDIWRPIAQAVGDLAFEAERGGSQPRAYWQELLEKVRKSRQWMRQHNPPAESPIKY